RMSEGVTDPTEQETMTYREDQAEQVRVSHILFLVPQSAGEQQRDSIRTVAGAVLDSVKSEVDFAELARRHSEDGTAQMGGDLGFFGRGAMVEAFEKASFGLVESGDVTEDLVETQYGYHIVKLTGRQTGELMDTTRAREMLMQTRRREAVQEAVDELRGKVTVHLNSEVVDTDINAQP
ncbi:MAG: peptidylprolyl isomerase, partial [Rhodothermales bacterium]